MSDRHPDQTTAKIIRELEAERDEARAKCDEQQLAIQRRRDAELKALRERDEARADLATAVEALGEAERGIGSLLWVINNRHNWAHPDFDGYCEAGEQDARRALVAITDALSNIKGEG